MPRLWVIADDLTGAVDTGVQFAKKNIPAFVTTEHSVDFIKWMAAFQVLVVNTDSRHLDAAEAATRVKTIVKQGQKAGVEYFYKKTDSTLRGNIGSELEALLEASGKRMLAFVPAFPALQRSTREGFQYTGGNLLHETAFAEDPLNPITESYIPKIISKQTRTPTKVVKISQLHDFELAKIEESCIYIFDGTTDDDLGCIGESLKRRGLLQAVAGSAGFAEHLPDLLEFERVPRRTMTYPTRMLVVNGSVSGVSLAQIAQAEACGFIVVTLPPEVIVPEHGTESRACQHIIAEIAERDSQGKDVLLQSIRHPEDVRAYVSLGEKLGLSAQQLHLKVAENMGRIVGKILENTGFELITVFGGDTLVSIARVLQWSGLLPKEEVSPGIAVSEVAGSEQGLIVITKAGGFGSENILQEIKDFLRSPSCRTGCQPV